MLLIVLASVAFAGQALAAWAIWFNHRHTPPVNGPTAPDPALFVPAERSAPDLLCVVPARNEESNIVACVQALAVSNYPGQLCIRVVDDGSTDQTAALVRELAGRYPRIELVQVEGPPPGWLGKNHALHVGTRGARQPWILFVDADLRVAPDCLVGAVRAAVERGADLLTMVPRLQADTFWERAVQPLVGALIYASLPAREINDPQRRKAAAAIGPFMLFLRSAYERIGGHEAVRAEVVEDRVLAERIKRAGLRLVLTRGIELASLRMYDSLGAIVRGWSKNFHVALGRASWAAPLAAAALLLVYAGPYVLPVIAAAAGDSTALAVGAASLAVALTGRVDLARRYGVAMRAPWLAPLGAAVVAFILIRSVLPRAIDWKGRAVRRSDVS